MRIKEMRQAAGLTQAELAAKINVNQTAVSQWERGIALPSCDKLTEIVDALGCSIDDLFVKNSKNTA